MSTQTKNDKSRSTKEYFAERAKRMYAAEPDVQNAAPIESSEQSMSSTPVETSVHTSSEGDVKTMGTKIAAPVKDDALKSSIDTPVPADDVDEQTMRNIIGAPIEVDELSEYNSRNAPDTDDEAPDLAATSNVGGGTAESGIPVHADRNDQTGARPAVDRSGKTGADTASTAPPAHTGGSEPSMQTAQTASTELREAITPTPQTAPAEPSIDSGDTRNSGDTAPAVPILDTDPARRKVKQRKSELDEYRQRYMKIPRIVDRKPIFVSHTTRDRLDRIVRLLGERGMSVSGLVENIALRHLEIHETDIEHWRKM